MLRWALGLTRLDHGMNEDVRRVMGVAPITEKMREAHLRWYGHVVRSDEQLMVKMALRLSPDGPQPRRRPKKRWLDRLKEDIRLANVAPNDALDWKMWRSACRKADPPLVQDKR